jgi:hypothetical protein
MAGYSGTPLPKKLGIRQGARVALVGAPTGFAATLRPLPAGVSLSDRPAGPLDVILLFVTARAALEQEAGGLAGALDPRGGLWIMWPKRASGVATDVTEQMVRDVGLAAGLVDNKVCAVDEVWSGLRFVVRLADRHNTPQPRLMGAWKV